MGSTEKKNEGLTPMDSDGLDGLLTPVRGGWSFDHLRGYTFPFSAFPCGLR
jgi:hypothetical protein